ncbi:MAG: DUF4139 domain-containing protein [Treponema sp.]|jgi:hypothetical protein|nr:DUF4139 domain-containing protein [Treponema sp.]
MRKITKFIVLFFVSVGIFPPGGGRAGLFAQTSPGLELPLRRVAIFSSGVGYFEHGGAVSGQAGIRLPFDVNAVNDALKSLMVSDPARGASPVVSYPSEETLEKTLKSLGVDLSGNPGTVEIFAAQRGAEIEVSAPNPISGRIAGVERRIVAGESEDFLSLYAGGGLKLIAIKDIGSFSFKDPALNADLERALDLIAANRASSTRNLLVTLNAAEGGGRDVSLSYVIPVPVWKVSYRLDLGQSAPLFQGWAIVDNGSDSDWNNVELSLVAGRPVSFIQELYPPYYLPRPVEPLAIAGTARAQSYAPGYQSAFPAADFAAEFAAPSVAPEALREKAASVLSARGTGGSVMAAAEGAAAGDQFSFTINKPVTLLRRQSAMLPLVDGRINAVKTLILSDASNVHPRLGAEITNTMGIKLPAGPITVYDGGVYAGDALIEFFSENDKRFISYGEDLSVTSSVRYFSARFVSTVTVSGGVMIINRRLVYERTYTVKNAGAETKRLIVEHPITGGAALIEPAAYLEKTDSLYRFVRNLPGGGEITFTVKEESPVSERIVLSQLREDSFVSYAANQEIPANVRAALSAAVELQRKAAAARQALAEIRNRKIHLAEEQDRVRQNLVAVGSGTEPGRNYLKRMTDLDREIDAVNEETAATEKLVQTAQAALDAYIAGLNLK